MVRDEFEIRKTEIEKYFIFLKEIEQNKWIGLVSEDLSKILKANGFLLLYNLIESCVYFSIIEIFEEIKNNGIKYVDVIPQIRLFWLKTKFKNQKEQTNNSVSQKFHQYINDIINEAILELEIKKIDYGGSLTPEKLRELAEDLGLIFNDVSYKPYPNGKALTNIKDKRNDLAHGKYSFGQIGKDLTYNGSIKQIGDNEPKIIEFGLTHYKEFTLTHLSEYISSVESFILKKQYKTANS
jgi:hypothetical protein